MQLGSYAGGPVQPVDRLILDTCPKGGTYPKSAAPVLLYRPTWKRKNLAARQLGTTGSG